MPDYSTFQIHVGIEIPSKELHSACSEPVILIGETNKQLYKYLL